MDKELLKTMMLSRGDTQAMLASEMGLSVSRFNLKLNSKRGAEFTQKEILFFVLRYDLSELETSKIFFAESIF